MARSQRASAADLARAPQGVPKRDLEKIPPVNIVLDNLQVEGGAQLELLTRSTPAMVRAARIAMFYSTMLKGDDGSMGIAYAQEQLNQVMRFAVSKDGKGRQENIDTVKAGGTMPDAFYEDGGGAQYAVSDKED